MSPLVRAPRCLAPLVWLAVAYVAVPVRAAPPPATVVADGVTEDATASNNQVKLVRDAAGLVVAYVGTGAGGAQIYLARSADGGAHWTKLAQASDGPAPSRLPAIALDASGRLHLMWTRYDDGVGKIYYRVWADRWVGPQQRISPPNGYAGYPGLTVDRAGYPHVVWYGIRGGGAALYTRHGSIYEIYYAGFDGRAWSDPLLISTGVPDSVNAAIAAGPGGRLFAVWYQYDGRTYQIRYAERDRTWTAPEGVFHTPSDEFNPDLAVDAGAQVSLAWEHHTDLNSIIEYARRVGGRWQGPVTLSASGSPARHPSVAVTSTGVVYVAWDQDDGQIYARRYGGMWGPVLRLTADGGNSFPAVAADGAAAAVVWTHTSGHRSSVDYARVAPK
ncbi:MAG TPA: sialidase family protein [bacterium]|nr:sialidase family protein [bacterium]